MGLSTGPTPVSVDTPGQEGGRGSLCQTDPTVPCHRRAVIVSIQEVPAPRSPTPSFERGSVARSGGRQRRPSSRTRLGRVDRDPRACGTLPSRRRSQTRGPGRAVLKGGGRRQGCPPRRAKDPWAVRVKEVRPGRRGEWALARPERGPLAGARGMRRPSSPHASPSTRHDPSHHSARPGRSVRSARTVSAGAATPARASAAWRRQPLCLGAPSRASRRGPGVAPGRPSAPVPRLRGLGRPLARTFSRCRAPGRGPACRGGPSAGGPAVASRGRRAPRHGLSEPLRPPPTRRGTRCGLADRGPGATPGGRRGAGVPRTSGTTGLPHSPWPFFKSLHLEGLSWLIDPAPTPPPGAFTCPRGHHRDSRRKLDGGGRGEGAPGGRVGPGPRL